jgi:hypothetical protein
MYRPSSRTGKIVLMAIVAIFLAVAGYAKYSNRKRFDESGRASEEARAAQYVRAYDTTFRQWRAQHPGEPCPTLETLVAADPAHLELLDPWGSRYIVLCENPSAADSRVISAGFDRKLRTADDIDIRSADARPTKP